MLTFCVSNVLDKLSGSGSASKYRGELRCYATEIINFARLGYVMSVLARISLLVVIGGGAVCCDGF